MPAFVLPVTDQPVLEPATGDEAWAFPRSPAAFAFADRDRIVLAVEMVGVDRAIRQGMLPEQLTEACPTGFGQV